MTSHRKRLTRDERHAACILMIARGDGTAIVSRDEAKSMTANQIIDAFRKRTEEEHVVAVSTARDIGWTREQINHPANVQFLAPDEHKPKTKRDVAAIAKGKRISKAQEEFRQRLLAKSGHVEAPADAPRKRKAKIPSRPFQKAPDGHKWFSKRGTT